MKNFVVLTTLLILAAVLPGPQPAFAKTTIELATEVGIGSVVPVDLISNVPIDNSQKDVILQNSTYEKYKAIHDKIKSVTTQNYTPKNSEGERAARYLVQYREQIDKYLAKHKELKAKYGDAPKKSIIDFAKRFGFSGPPIEMTDFVEAVERHHPSVMDEGFDDGLKILYEDLSKTKPGDFNRDESFARDYISLLFDRFLPSYPGFVAAREKKRDTDKRAAAEAARREAEGKNKVSSTGSPKSGAATQERPANGGYTYTDSEIQEIINRHKATKGGWKDLKWGMSVREVDAVLHSYGILPRDVALESLDQSRLVFVTIPATEGKDKYRAVIARGSAANSFINYVSVVETGFVGYKINYPSPELPFSRLLHPLFYEG